MVAGVEMVNSKSSNSVLALKPPSSLLFNACSRSSTSSPDWKSSKESLGFLFFVIILRWDVGTLFSSLLMLGAEIVNSNSVLVSTLP